MASPAAPALPRVAHPARARTRAVAVAVAALAVAGSVAATRPGPSRPAPAFSLDEVRGGGTVALPAGRPAVVNFFASWCAPCREELPLLERAHRRVGGTVAFLGVDVADSRSAATDLLRRTGARFPAGYDPGRRVADRYGVRGLPTTVFVDAAGRLAGVVKGRLTAAELDRRLASIGPGGPDWQSRGR